MCSRIQLLYNTFQVRFFWPQQQLKEDGLMMEKEAFEAKKDDTAYMSDELGQEIFTYIFDFLSKIIKLAVRQYQKICS